MKYGTDNLIKILNVALEAINVADKMALEQGGTGAKMSHAMLLFDELMLLPTVDFTLLDDEFKDLDDAEKGALSSHFAAKFDISNDQAERRIEKGFSFILKLEGLVKEALALAKEFKDESKEDSKDSEEA